MKKWIDKNFKFLVLGLLLIGAGFSVYSVVASGDGKAHFLNSISWPNPQNGYIGDPSDAQLAGAEGVNADDSIYNLLGKISQKIDNIEGGGGGGPCGTCTQVGTIYSYPTSATTDGGCCQVKYGAVCEAPDDGMMIFNEYCNSRILGSTDRCEKYYCYEY